MAKGPGDIRGALGVSCPGAEPSELWDGASSEQVLVGGEPSWMAPWGTSASASHQLEMNFKLGEGWRCCCAGSGVGMEMVTRLGLGRRCSSGWDGDISVGSGVGMEMFTRLNEDV